MAFRLQLALGELSGSVCNSQAKVAFDRVLQGNVMRDVLGDAEFSCIKKQTKPGHLHG